MNIFSAGVSAAATQGVCLIVARLFLNNKDRILEFHSRLLQALALSAAIPIEKRENPISKIAATVRDVLDVYFLYTYHLVSNDKYELRFFWPDTPSEGLRETAVRSVTGAIESDQPLAKTTADISITHTVAVAGAGLPPIDPAALDLRSQPFFLDTPPGKGMAGIGIRKTGKERLEDSIALDNILLAVIGSVVSARAVEAYAREIERFATRDPLTNLYNQNAFWDLLGYEIERSKRQQYRFSLLVIDLDDFKAFNDTCGHEVGDRLLKEFSTILKNAIRAGDIAARYGGDQFTAILPVCDEGQAYIVARRIIENVREFSMTLSNGTVIRQTASIGVAVFPDHATETKDVYLLAESMMTQAKTFGKDRLSMPSEHNDLEILKSMGDKHILILEALSKRKIVPYFQPIVNMKDMKIEAYEVLTRIVMNGRVIPAIDFIETAENMGAIGRIDYQLFEMAFAKVRECRYDGDLFLNLSPRALAFEEFLPTIRKLISDYRMEPEKMVFEITERDTATGHVSLEKHVRDLKSEGFRFAIDDFGAGYSSFQYIRNLSVDFLKVDGEFIRNMNGNNNVEKAIVSSIASLSEKLGIKTIAEFVETKEILGHVESAGIHYAQGYYIKRPSPELI
jgi:diguanylate cyclase (GGDEF)-like protein